MDIDKVEIRFSLMGGTISQQLKQQKISFDRQKNKEFDEMAFQAMALHFHGLLTEKNATMPWVNYIKKSCII